MAGASATGTDLTGQQRASAQARSDGDSDSDSDTGRPTEESERIAFADAALAVAGHQVTDPQLGSVLGRQDRHELTGDQAREAIRRCVFQDVDEWAGPVEAGTRGAAWRDRGISLGRHERNEGGAPGAQRCSASQISR